MQDSGPVVIGGFHARPKYEDHKSLVMQYIPG